jgi:hypothetical protein
MLKDKNLMTVRKARSVVIIICIILVVISFSQLLTDDDPKRASADDLPFIAVFLGGMIAVAIFSYFYLRCPKCGKHLTRSEIGQLRCASCGAEFKE